MKQLVITIPDECEKYSLDIKRFVDAMVYKLRKNASKGRWEELTVPYIRECLGKEVVELDGAISENNVVEVMLEAADVANFAMIISTMYTEGQDAKSA